MTAAFGAGERVRVRALEKSGHVRTPGYARGKTGTIERICGSFANPEELAYGRAGAAVVLYRVRFDRREIWPGDPAGADTIDVEIYEHWLEEA